jgi:hypothetical protein
MADKGLKIFRDGDLEDEVTDGSLVFDPVKAGEETVRSIYVLNSVDYVIEVDSFVLESSEEVEVLSDLESVEPGESRGIRLRFAPDFDVREPVELSFSINYSFTVR